MFITNELHFFLIFLLLFNEQHQFQTSTSNINLQHQFKAGEQNLESKFSLVTNFGSFFTGMAKFLLKNGGRRNVHKCVFLRVKSAKNWVNLQRYPNIPI